MFKRKKNSESVEDVVLETPDIAESVDAPIEPAEIAVVEKERTVSGQKVISHRDALVGARMFIEVTLSDLSTQLLLPEEFAAL